ncbi:MAG: sensor histidine kinase [Candidatus Solibacter sp.]|jgi:signal transduction histidine kinase
METLILPFFPFPHVIRGERRPGYGFSAPPCCEHCTRHCEKTSTTEIGLCPHGFNFIRRKPEFLIFGFLIESQNTSAAHKKALRHYRSHILKPAEIERASQTFETVLRDFGEDIDAKKKAIIDEYRRTKRYQKEFLDNIRPEIQKSFSFLHDYRQFIARVRQNINVVLEHRYPGEDLDQKLSAALPAEKAIYWASILMEEKLQTAFLLLHPERITNPTDLTVFRLHGLVTKYLRIYDSAFAAKDVKVRVVGSSIGEIKGNGAAVPVIPHTLIDNALKYSERGAEVLIKFAETDHDVELSVSSYGPNIDDDEFEKIFEIFYRGRNATRQEEEGAGFGLYLAQFIANQMGTRIQVTQTRDKKGTYGFWTTFSVRFTRER